MKLTSASKLFAVALLAGASTLLAATLNSTSRIPTAKGLPAEAITGDYVESRTASVFCGECHYNSQMDFYGHDALMAWKFDAGTYNGVSLKGVRVMADVTSDENLKFHTLPHAAQLVIDTAATSEQVAAVTALLQEKCPELGTIKLVNRAPVNFVHDDQGYRVSAEGFGTMHVSYRTDNACCTMPGTVWYTPLSPTAGRKVGYTEDCSYTGALSAPWSQAGDDYAMYGAISF